MGPEGCNCEAKDADARRNWEGARTWEMPHHRGDNWDIWRDVIMPVKDRGGPPGAIPPGLRLALSMGRCVDMETRPGSGRR